MYEVEEQSQGAGKENVQEVEGQSCTSSHANISIVYQSIEDFQFL